MKRIIFEMISSKTRDNMMEYLETISKDLPYQKTSFYDKKLDVKPHEL